MLETALKAVRRGKDCWCDMAIGHPLMNRHSRGCLLARKALNIE